VSDEHERLKEIDRAQTARNVLDNPLWVEAFTSLESELIAVLRTHTDVEEIYKANLTIRLLDAFRGRLETHILTGEMAATQLSEMEGSR